MSFRREVIVGLGGFDEHFGGNAFRWENDFCVRVRRAGWRVVYDPRPTVHHYYASPGGNENKHLLGREPGSHAWYRHFFHNHVYFALKHQPRAAVASMLWRLYRGHVMNRPYAREGLPFLLARHRAFVGGLARGMRAWREAARSRGRPT
jgi:GT2 family glycosyltransferase